MRTTEEWKTQRDKVKGALIGIAYGDAFGMATEMWTPGQIRERVGTVDAFREGHPENPISANLKKGEVTDDTINSILVIQMLAENHGKTDPILFLNKLKRWMQGSEKSSTVVGPSTRRAMELLEKGVPIQETGKTGTTNGGAMKILPVGLLSGIRACGREPDEEELLLETANLCMPTHNTSCAISGAAAIAAGGAAAVCGWEKPERIFAYMIHIAEKAQRLGTPVCGPLVSERMRMNQYFVENDTEQEALYRIYSCTGTGLPSAESVPAAAALFLLAKGNPEKCARYAANIGGDTDTIGAMACGICGAFSGAGCFSQEEVELLEQVNQISFDALTELLLGCA